LATQYFYIFQEKITKSRVELSENANNVGASVENIPEVCLLAAFEPSAEAETRKVLN